MKEFKISHLGSNYILKVKNEDVETMKDMFKLSFNVWDFIDQLNFMNIKHTLKVVK